MNFLLSLYDRLISAFCWWLCALMPQRARVIPHAEDPTQPLLQQFLIWHRPAGAKPSLSVYLQHFLTPESPRFAHRHRWQYMRSFVLSGFFVEHRHVPIAVFGKRWLSLWHRAPCTYTMVGDDIHHVIYWSRHCWTLFFAYDAQDDWGYYDVENGMRFIPWRQHIKRRVASLETGELTK